MKNSSTLLLASLLLSTALSAQTKPCVSMNDSTNKATGLITAKSFAGPGHWALQWTPGSTYVAQSLTIFTGSKYLAGFHSLEVWSQDAKTKKPGVRLAGGTWYLPKGTVQGWYGTNLDKIQVLAKGTTYWIVWIEPGWSNLPHEVGGKPSLPLVRRSGSVGSWTMTPAWGFKFRLYCSPQDKVVLKPVGKPCTGAEKLIATSFSNTFPLVGNSAFRIEGTGVPSGAASFLLLGAKKAFQPIPLNAAATGCFLNTDIVMLLVGKSGTGNQQAKPAVGAAHHVRFDLPIPNNTSLKGSFLGTQIAVFDAKSKNKLPMVFTNGLQITFQ